jgi:hypothetical protein
VLTHGSGLGLQPRGSTQSKISEITSLTRVERVSLCKDPVVDSCGGLCRSGSELPGCGSNSSSDEQAGGSELMLVKRIGGRCLGATASESLCCMQVTAGLVDVAATSSEVLQSGGCSTAARLQSE